MKVAQMNAEAIREPAPFEVRIHRGAHEIGGNCVELRHGQDTLILDIGKPLTAAWGTVIPLPAAIGSRTSWRRRSRHTADQTGHRPGLKI